MRNYMWKPKLPKGVFQFQPVEGQSRQVFFLPPSQKIQKIQKICLFS